MRLSLIIIESVKHQTGQLFSTRSGMGPLVARDSDFQRGFTMTELIMVLVIVGILAAIVAPRFFQASIFQSRGFADQVQATLRYAQKEAIAQRRYVCVTFPTNNSIQLMIGTTTACGSNLPPLSGGAATYSITANPATITFQTLPAGFYFSAGGVPSTGQTIIVSGAPNSIVVEAQTGYVHSP